jgi:hypothetical protein
VPTEELEAGLAPSGAGGTASGTRAALIAGAARPSWR